MAIAIVWYYEDVTCGRLEAEVNVGNYLEPQRFECSYSDFGIESEVKIHFTAACILWLVMMTMLLCL